MNRSPARRRHLATRPRVLAVLILAACGYAGTTHAGRTIESAGLPDRQSRAAAPPRVVEAQIVEGPPSDPSRMGEREIRFRVITDGAPPCEPGRDEVRYVFVLDAQPWLHGGVVLDAVPELRATAGVELACDPAAREFRSRVSGRPTPVRALRAPGGTHVLEAATTLAGLPAVEFQWVLLAFDATSFTRTPERGRTALWRIRERVLR